MATPAPGQCTCPAGEITTQTASAGAGGAQSYSLGCSSCAAGEYAGPGWECKKCANYAMEYKEVPEGGRWECACRAGYVSAGSGCVTQADFDELTRRVPAGGLEGTKTLTYNSVVRSDGTIGSSDGVVSEVFDYHFVQGAIGCWKYKSPASCQVLANLCVLTLYQEGSGACQFFNELADAASENTNRQYPLANWKQGLPWLTYKQQSTTQGAPSTPLALLRTPLRDSGFQVTVGFYDDTAAGRSQYLPFQLGRYAMNGTFLGYTELKSQLSVCPMSFHDVQNQNRFGTITVNNCELFLQDLLRAERSLANEANIFYELYLQDDNGNFVDVPVLVRNYRLRDGSRPNLGTEISDSWKLVRRFLIYDTISGLDQAGSYPQADQEPRYVRWASSVQIKVAMDASAPEQIFRPYVIVDYREKEASLIEESTKVAASFQMEYFSDYTSLLTWVAIIFTILNLLALVLTAFKFRYYTQRNPRSVLKEDAPGCYAFKIIYYLVDTWSELMFWLLFFTSATIFIAYKAQMNAHLLLPEPGPASDHVYRAFNAVFATTLACKLLKVLMRIGEQARIDLYLVDFEGAGRDLEHVNAWRYLFVANELAELQTGMRYVEPETAFIWFTFFWVGLGWQHLAQADPELSELENPILDYNAFLKFFMVSVLFLAIGAVQVFLHNLSAIFNGGSDLNQFVDLCTLANISVVMLDEHSHGYYIHAKCPWGSSDIPLDWLQKELQKEAANKLASTRGLRGRANDGPPVQTFQIYVPGELRQRLARVAAAVSVVGDAEYDVVGDQEHGASRRRRNRDGTARDVDPAERRPLKRGAAQSGALTAEEKAITQAERRKAELTKLLKEKLGDRIDPGTQLKVESLASRLLSAPPDGVDVEKLQDLVVVEDKVEQYPSFYKLLYCSLDYTLVLLYIMLFIFFEMLLGDRGNSLLSLFLVYLVERALRKGRQSTGTDNLCEKAYVDGRFLG